MLLPNRESSLSLSISVKAHKVPKASSKRERGVHPQTSYSKKMVRNCVYRLESLYGKHNLAFITLTLPGLPEEQIFYLLKIWGEVTRQVKQEYERELSRADLEPQLVYVTEIQMERYKKTGIPVPHIHLICQSRKNRNSPYAITKERNTLIWNRIINNLLKCRVEMPNAAEIKTVRKSAEAYISKYMSKGSDIAAELDNQFLRDILPKSWWGATLSLRRWVKDNTKVFTESTKEYIRANYKRWLKDIDNSPFIYLHVIEFKNAHGEMIPICLVGKIRKYFLHMFPAVPLVDKPMPWAV